MRTDPKPTPKKPAKAPPRAPAKPKRGFDYDIPKKRPLPSKPKGG